MINDFLNNFDNKQDKLEINMDIKTFDEIEPFLYKNYIKYMTIDFYEKFDYGYKKMKKVIVFKHAYKEAL